MATQRTDRQNRRPQREEYEARDRRPAARTKKKKKRNVAVLIIELLVLVIMLVVLWFVTRVTDEETGIQRVDLTEEDVTINEEVQENEVLSGYRTIALFGLDSTVGDLALNTRSDTIMIAALDNETKQVHLMSVYRDTYLNLGNDTYNKCNAAYAKGGPKQAINMLNLNLDLDITDFVAVGFKGVADVVDAVGGIYIDVDSAELEHINNYQIGISENLQTSYTPVTETGYQLLDGIQATAYCRIRYTAGDDFKRTERQREVLQAILDQAKKMDITALTKIANNVFGNVYTSVELEEIISLLGDIASYEIVDEGGFPSEEYRTTGNIGSLGDCVVSTDLEAAVTELHKALYQNEEYTPSSEVQNIGAEIHTNTDRFVN